jgi:hypothetical protein
VLLSGITNLGEGRDFELEDLISVPFYHSAVLAAYPGLAIDPPDAEERRKRTKIYEQKFRELGGGGFNKRRVAEQIKKLIGEGKIDQETSDQLKPVIEQVIGRLEQQVAPNPVADDELSGVSRFREATSRLGKRRDSKIE